MFWQRRNDSNSREKDINSSEYDKCLRRFSEGDSRIAALETKIELLKTDVANLRGKFNQRLTGLKVEEQKAEEAKDINTSNEIPFG